MDRAGFVRPMRADHRWWVTGALLVAGAEGALLLSARFVLGASHQVHASLFELAAAVFSAPGTMLPAAFTEGVRAILGLLGADWWTRQLILAAPTSQMDAGIPALAGVLAAPAYAAVRRMSPPSRAAEARRPVSPPRSAYVAAAPENGPAA